MDLLGNSLRSAIHIEILFRSYPRGWDVLPEGIIVHRASRGSEQDLRAQLDCTRSIASGGPHPGFAAASTSVQLGWRNSHGALCEVGAGHGELAFMHWSYEYDAVIGNTEITCSPLFVQSYGTELQRTHWRLQGSMVICSLSGMTMASACQLSLILSAHRQATSSLRIVEGSRCVSVV